MYAFIYIKSLVDYGTKDGSLIYDNFKYTTTKNVYMPMNIPPSFFDYFSFVQYPDMTQIFQSTIKTFCQFQGQSFQNYSRIAIVATDQNVRTQAQQYFQNYVLVNQGVSNFQVDSFNTSDYVFNTVQTVSYQPYCFLIEFKSFDTNLDKYDISYSFPINNLPNTLLNSFNPLIRSPNINAYNKWFNTGAVSLYPYITEFIARYKSQNVSIMNQSNSLFVQQMGYAPLKPSTYQDILYQGFLQLTQNFPFFFMIIFKIPFFYITSRIASEKESKAKEGMKMMGLRDFTYYFAWFILYMSISIFTSIIVTLISMRGVFIRVNSLLFFIFCLLYSINLFAWAFIIVAFLPTKRSSGIASVLINFITFYMTFIIKDEATPSINQYALSVLPNVCMNQIIKQIFFYNFQTDSGLNFSNGNIQYQGFSFNNGLIQLTIISIFWTFLGIYLDQVVPSEYGVSKPWFFLCNCFKKRQKTSSIIDDEETKKIKNPQNFEEVQDSLKKQEIESECLKIRQLKKLFGQKIAVNNLDLTMYNGQIFALLGHNGAGKTTTLSMLTGLIQPTEGRAEVFGVNIFKNMNEVRMMLGVCPQHDILFESLTPEEHLRLYASFKGTESNIIESQVQQMLIDIDLVDVKTQLAGTLSGGQKRKLSVAIAMIGNSKIVLLDEPSSGMDTTARRILWEMLKKNKNGKIIILTTHYMDEADILGDRIAIMAEGDVQCTGSSLFLKNRFGVGYNLKIVKNQREPAPQIDEFILQRIFNAKKMQEVSNEISYQLPTHSQQLFTKFFTEFDQNLQNLGIRSYGVGITTLEEVFLKIGHGQLEQKITESDQQIINQQNSEQTEKKLMDQVDEVEINDIDSILENYTVAENKDENQFFEHLIQLIRKKVLVQIRDLKTLGIDTLFPIILIIVGLYLATIAVIKQQSSKPMSLQLYPTQTVFYNLNSKYIQNQSLIRDFMQNQLINQDNQTLNLQQGPYIQIDNSTNTTQQIEQFDQFIYNQVQNGSGIVLGDFYAQTLNHPIEGYSGILLINSTQQDTVGVWAGIAHQAFLRQYCIDNTLNIQCQKNISVNFINAPFPLDQRAQAIIKTAAGATSGLLMAIAWLMISDSLIQNIVKEKARNIKHQIIISGSSIAAYWIGHYIGDIIFQSILSLVSIIGYYAFGINVPQAWVLFVLMVFNNPPFIYFLSLLVQREEQGSLLIKIVYFSVGVIIPIVIQLLQIFAPSTIVVANTIKWIFYPFPIFSMTFGYISICNRQIIQVNQNLSSIPDSFSLAVAAPALGFMIGTTFFYWLLIILFELRFFDYIHQKILKLYRIGSNHVESISQYEDFNLEDNDVQKESQRVKNTESQNMIVRVDKIKKKYGDFLAVNNVSFGLEYGECFALLGITGAGKTSCFKCLTGEMYPDSGSLTINGHDITKQRGFDKARRLIGYCPQFDAIFDGLTVLEHLQIYATLKGVRKDIKNQIINKQIEEMDLTEYTHIRANNLSGGNKRKLSVAIAIIGNPPIIFLDEPSTGVDPQAKRFMWNIVSKISTLKKKSAVIITTHSMEEAEALCSKMGIMVGGEFKCFGSSQHIKDKYGTGYEIEIKIRTLNEDEVQELLSTANKMEVLPFNLQSCQKYLTQQGNDPLFLINYGKDYYEALKNKKLIKNEEIIKWEFTEKYGNKALEYLKQKFKNFEILEHFGNNWKLKVSRDDYSIGFMFGMMTEIQKDFNISEYSVTQTTLEQIFNNFALQADRDAKKLLSIA